MKIDKSTVIAAPIERVWEMLFDTKAIAACVPGLESIEEVHDMEYVVQVKVKISFISARFKIRAKVVEKTVPSYVLSESTGEDSTLTSSLKLRSEVFLVPRDSTSTDVTVKVDVEVFGRLGTFGLSVVRTKADRMWDEACRNLAAYIQARTS